MINKFQTEANAPLSFTMDKELLKLIPKVAANPFYNNEANWYRVSFIFKHTESRRRFVPCFRDVSSTRRLKVRNGMQGGDEFKLKKIIISQSNRSHLVIWENEIPDVSSFDFALLDDGVEPDITSPILTSLIGPAAGEYTAGDVLSFNLNFDEPVLVTGQPKLYLDIGFVYKEASYVSGSGSSSLLFRYTVGNSDIDTEGIQLDSFNLNGGSIKDPSGNNAFIDISGFSLNTITITNDLTAPVLNSITSSSPALLETGDVLSLSVNFSEPVVVTGSPLLVLDFDGVAVNTEYDSVDGSSVIFKYTIQESDVAQSNFSVQELDLNGGSIKDSNGNNAGIIFSPLTINSQINPDVTAPTVISAEVGNSENSPFFVDDVVQFEVLFSENVVYTGSPRLALSINSQTKYASISSALSTSSMLVFEYTVSSQDLGDVTIQSIDLNSGTIKDAVGNNANLSFDSVSGSIQLNPDIIAPTVLSVNGIEGDYSTGDSIEFTVQFSENIQVSGLEVEYLVLSLDSGTVNAPISSVSGDTITFSYTVTENDEALEGLTISSIQLGDGGFIKDASGNTASLGFNPMSKEIIINAEELTQIYRLGFANLFNNAVNSIVQQSDGRFVVGGSFTTYNGASANYIIRLNADGSRDTSFDIGTGFNNTVSSIVQQSDGRFVVGGSFITYNGVTANCIIRLNADGSRDTSFDTGTGFNSNVNSIVQQSDGKLVVGGFFSTYQLYPLERIARIESNGGLEII